MIERPITGGMPLVPAPPARPQDQPLRDDVRRLAAALGRVIRRLEGEEAFQAVEALRRAARARRSGDADAPTLDALLERVGELPLPLAGVTARAFTLFFLLINTAEQVHRVRRSQEYARSESEEPQHASARWTMRRLRESGRGADEVMEAMARLEVRPVLTAHPTESTRRTLLALQARVADLLLAREGLPESERRALDDTLDGEVELLWLTSETRQDRPSVGDEVSTVLWYLETRLLDAGAKARDTLVRAFEDEFGATAEPLRVPVPLRIGNWVGGDRDGNPFVTPASTVAAARRASHVILGRYARALDGLVERLSLSARLAPPTEALLAAIEEDRPLLPEVWEANRRRNADEPLRLKLTFMTARIAATRRLVAARDAGVPTTEPAAYANAEAFERDLLVVREYLVSVGAAEASRTALDPFLAGVRALGFHGFMMDLRDHADSHRAALDDVAARLELGAMDGDALRRELTGRRPLVAAHVPLDEATRRVLDTMHAMRQVQDEMGADAARTYIVSMTTSPEDLLRVLLLAREAGLVDLAADPPVSRLDVVPLFETLDDLHHAPGIMRGLFEDPVYARQLAARGGRQEVMIGYSDSGKDAGILASSWGLYQVQESLTAVADEAGVTLTLFHGRGGSVGRGGGSPVHRALAALPPATAHGRVKITEQGEIISQQFGLLPVAERSFEVTLAGVLLQQFTDWRTAVDPSEVTRFRDAMDALAERALQVYRALVHEDPALFALFERVTPIAELADARFGSRPAYRPGAARGIGGIRAIPWQFGWTQIRLMLPGWLGVGTALSEMSATPEGTALLRRMAQAWPFFDDLLAKIEMVCAKTDLDIARTYVTRLGGDTALLARLETEFARTVASVLHVRGTERLIEDTPVLQAAIALRNPYVDALSLLQVDLLMRKARTPEARTPEARMPEAKGEATEERSLVKQALATTLSGIAQGLRNTG